MFLTHTNSVYSNDIVLIDHVPYPQYVHQIGDGGGTVVDQGIKLMPGELIDYVLKGRHGAHTGTESFINQLTKVPNNRVGFILAAGGNTWTGLESNVKRTDKYPVYKIPPMALTQVYAGYVANKLGSFDYIATDSTSCISGHSAWYTAKNMLALNQLDTVVVVTVDNGLSEEYLSVFGEYGLSKLANEENDPAVLKFRLGHGCNISVFQSLESVHDTGSVILAKVTGMHIAAENHTNPLGISCSGEGYKKVIDNVDTNGIDFIKTHSTFSKDNDIEDIVIKEKFGTIPTISYKLRIGHTLGASTAIETALAIEQFKGKFLSLGAGMGNVFSSAVVEIA